MVARWSIWLNQGALATVVLGLAGCAVFGGNGTHEAIEAEIAAIVHKRSCCAAISPRGVKRLRSMALKDMPEVIAIATNGASGAELAVRRGAVMALGLTKCKVALSAIVGIVEDSENTELRADAITALGNFPEGDVRERLLTCFGSYPQSRIAVIQTMGEMKSDAFVPVLVSHALEGDRNAQTPFLAIEALRSIGSLRALHGAEVILASNDEERRVCAADVVAGLGGDSVVSLVPLLASRDRQTQMSAIVTLGYIRGERSYALLDTFAASSCIDTRLSALRGLAIRGGIGSVEDSRRLIQGMLDDSEEEVRFRAYRALWYELNQKTQGLVKKMAGDTSLRIQDQARRWAMELAEGNSVRTSPGSLPETRK